MEVYKKHRHSVYSLNYHIVLVTKYRRKVITEPISEFLKEKACYLMEKYGGSLIEAETDKDHIHLLVEFPPKLAPANVVNNLKTQLSKEVRNQFKEEIERG